MSGSRPLLPLAVLGLGALSIVLLVASVRLQQRADLETLALVDALGRVQADAAVSHLWMEELVSGDEVDVDEIGRRLTRSIDRLDVMLGETPPPAGSELRPLDRWSPELRAAALELRSALGEFRQITDDRRLGYERGLAVSIGSAFDVEYDRVFGQLLASADRVDVLLRERRAETRRHDAMRLVAILGAWAAGVVAAAIGLWSRERRLALSRERLERSQTLEALGRFARGLAHDLNNYLAALRAQGELIATRSSDTTARERAGTIVGTVDRASGLLERLRTFGAETDAARPVDLVRLLHDARGVLEAAVGAEDGRSLELDLRSVPRVRIDPAALDQVMLNLAVNAREAMPEGGTVTIETRRLEAGDGAGEAVGDEVILRVRDTGVGVPEEHLEAIFEPLFTRKGGEHTGLGLSIVDRIVRLGGGRVAVRSEVGVGTTFEIVLPAVADADEAGVEQPCSGTLLLVDGDEEWREATGALLETLGYDVATADSLAAALEAVAEDVPDAVLVDRHLLPSADAAEPLRRLRAACGGVPMLLLDDVRHDARDAPTAALAGLDGVVSVVKEPSTVALRDALRRVLPGR